MKNLFEELHKKRVRDSILDPPPIPEDVKTWLGRLTLLYGVPFHYLVPDERMLEPESLRLFYVDPLWMEALIDGALSIGRTEDVRLLLNKTMAATYTKDATEEARKVRPRQQRGADAALPTSASPSDDASFAFSGFLMRSEIVSGWRGLDVVAYPKPEGRASGGPLNTLRLERLARDTLFGLVEGHLHSLEVTQPPEGLHFDAGEALKRSGDERVLDVVRFAKAQGSALDSSAAFAERLLAQPLRYTISIGT